MSDADIDSLYRKFASDLSLDIDKEKGSIDEMQLRVESITNKFSDLRNENMEMLKVYIYIYTYIKSCTLIYIEWLFQIHRPINSFFP